MSSFINFQQLINFSDITTRAIGEEGGSPVSTQGQEGGVNDNTPHIDGPGGLFVTPTNALDSGISFQGQEGGVNDNTPHIDGPGAIPPYQTDYTTNALGEEGGHGEENYFIGGPHPLPSPNPDPFISFHNHEGGIDDLPIVTKSLGENGGDGGEQYTTMALGEEGGGFNPQPIITPGPDPISTHDHEGGGDDLNTTMALGEEGGGDDLPTLRPRPKPGIIQEIIADLFKDRLYARFNRNFFATGDM